MSFNNNAQRNTQSNQQDESWKSQGFLNFYLPSKEAGKRKKLGFIPLKANKPSEKALLEWLNEDPMRAQQILAKLEIDYQSAAPGEASGFDLT